MDKQQNKEIISNKPTLCVILPLYQEAGALSQHFQVIHQTLEASLASMENLSIHYTLVDDGSSDGTWEVIKDLSEKYRGVSGIRFARNFGKETALMAGIKESLGDYYLLMDSDLQHPPDQVAAMFKLMTSTGADVVNGIKTDRGKESASYRKMARLFYRILNQMTGFSMQDSSDFKLLNNKAAGALRDFRETKLFFRGVVDWVGFKQVAFPFEVKDRLVGKSSFSTWKLMKLGMNAVLSYTSKPLYLVIGLGLGFLAASVVLGIQTLYNFFAGIASDGFSTVILLILITGSMLMLSLGMIGVYIARIYDEIKQRPIYLITEKILN